MHPLVLIGMFSTILLLFAGKFKNNIPPFVLNKVGLDISNDLNKYLLTKNYESSIKYGNNHRF